MVHEAVAGLRGIPELPLRCSQGRTRVFPDSRPGSATPGWHDEVRRQSTATNLTAKKRGKVTLTDQASAAPRAPPPRPPTPSTCARPTAPGQAAVHALAGVNVDLRAGPLHRRHGPVGLGQVHADALHGRAGPADIGAVLRRRSRHRHPRRRRAHPAAARPDRLRVPVLQPGADPDGGGEHHAARRPGRPEGRPGLVRLPGRPAGHRRPPDPPAHRAVGRAAAAGGVRPGPDQPARARLRRRAHREPRLERLGGDAVVPAHARSRSSASRSSW